MSDRRSGGPLLLGIAVACVALILSVGVVRSWLSERTATRAVMPVLEGRIEISGLESPVEIWRDGAGWPHIVAASDSDGWLALGFVHAQDRLQQMLWLRRLARGRASELIGPAGLEADRLTRIIGLARIAEREATHLSPEVDAAFAAYSRGVNARLERLAELRDRSGAPDGDLDSLGPWVPADSLAIYKLVSWSSGNSIDVAVVLSDLIERLGGLGARPFFPTPGAVRGVSLPVDWPSESDESEVVRSEPLRPALLDAARLDGSAWVRPPDADVAAPLLSAQLTFGTGAPALVHPAHLVGGEIAVAGAAIPGLPVFWCGRSRGVAWAANPAQAVVTDLFSETLRPNDGRAYHDGIRWTPLDEREEWIPIRGGEPERLLIRATHHGPLIDQLLSPDREAMAVAWVGARPGSGPGALMTVARAGTADEIESTIDRHRDPVINLAYADREGRRGVRVAGWLPRRILPSSGVPVPGRMRAFNWYEPVPAEELPARRAAGRARVDSPPIIAADAPLPEGRGTAKVEWLWRRGVRSDPIARRLGGVGTEGAGDVDEVATWFEDDRQVGVRAVVRAMRALAPEGPALGAGPSEILDVLDDWDGRFDVDSAGAVLYRSLLVQLVQEIFEPVFGADLLARYSALPGTDPQWVAAAVLVAAAESDSPGSWADRSRVKPALAEALRETWTSVRYRLGPNRARWQWGRIHQIGFHDFARPDLARSAPGLPPEPVAIGGSRHTLHRTESVGGNLEVTRFDGYRLLVDLALDIEEPESFRAIVAPGVPEQPAVPGYASGFEDWRRGRLHPWPGMGELEADRGGRRLTLVPGS